MASTNLNVKPSPRTSVPTDGNPRRSWAYRLAFGRREFGVGLAAFLIWSGFAVVSGGQGFLSNAATISYLSVAAELGILVTGLNLLMIAGEFDLSVGSVIGLSGIVLALPIVQAGWPLWVALLLVFAVATVIGLINGFLVTKTGVPSLIVTLAMLFALRGITIVVTRLVTDSTQISGVREALAGNALGTRIDSGFLVQLFIGKLWGLPASFYWWLALTAFAVWILEFTPVGNWIYASGGDTEAARRVGIPVNKVKIALFVLVALLATVSAIIGALEADTADVARGQGTEFEAATAVVIGGTLIMGGYGSAIGAALGTFIFAVVNQGFFYTNIDADWFQIFLGAMLLSATLFNQWILSRAARRR